MKTNKKYQLNNRKCWIAYLSILLLWGNVAYAALQIPIAKKITELQADLNQPSDIASDKQGQLYILDAMNSRVVVFSSAGKQLREIKPESPDHSFKQAMALAIDKNELYIADSQQHRIRHFTLQGKWLNDINLSPPKMDEKVESKKLAALQSPWWMPSF